MIFLVRHGEPAATWGAAPDPGLTEAGRAQAEVSARLVAEAGARRSISSPLARCRQTARPFELLLETHCRIEPSVGEIRTPVGVADRPAWLKQVMAGRWSDQDGALADWRRSLLAVVEACADNTVIFSHFVAINAVAGLLTGDDRVLVFRPGHASITRLERRGGKLRVAELGAETATGVL